MFWLIKTLWGPTWFNNVYGPHVPTIKPKFGNKNWHRNIFSLWLCDLVLGYTVKLQHSTSYINSIKSSMAEDLWPFYFGVRCSLTFRFEKTTRQVSTTFLTGVINETKVLTSVKFLCEGRTEVNPLTFLIRKVPLTSTNWGRKFK